MSQLPRMPGLVQPFAARCERGRGTGRVDSGYPYSNIPPHLPPISIAQFSFHVPCPAFLTLKPELPFSPITLTLWVWAGVQQVTLI